MDMAHNIEAALVFAFIGITVFVAGVRHHRPDDAVSPVEARSSRRRTSRWPCWSARCRSASASSSPPPSTEPVAIALFRFDPARRRVRARSTS